MFSIVDQDAGAAAERDELAEDGLPGKGNSVRHVGCARRVASDSSGGGRADVVAGDGTEFDDGDSHGGDLHAVV